MFGVKLIIHHVFDAERRVDFLVIFNLVYERQVSGYLRSSKFFMQFFLNLSGFFSKFSVGTY